MHSNIPQLANEQRSAARHKSIEHRRLRASFKNDINKGLYTCEEAIHIAKNDDVLKRMPVRAFIKSHRGIGITKTNRLMEQLCISEHTRMRGLGPVQTKNLCAYFDAHSRHR